MRTNNEEQRREGLEALTSTAVAQLVDKASDVSLAALRSLQFCVLLLTPSGRISFVNRAGLTMLEIEDHDSVAGRPWWDLWPTGSRDLIRHAIQSAVEGEPLRFDTVWPTRLGALRWCEVTMTPLANLDGVIESLLVAMTDVSGPWGDASAD